MSSTDIEPEDVVEALSGIRAGWSTGVAGIPDKILVAVCIALDIPALRSAAPSDGK